MFTIIYLVTLANKVMKMSVCVCTCTICVVVLVDEDMVEDEGEQFSL